ncbi:MAG: matrixin family metalloprotease [Sandaracinus sp.]
MAAEHRARAVRWAHVGMATAGLVALAGLAPSRAEAWCQMVSGNVRPTVEEPCVLASNHEGIHPLAWRHRCTSISVSSALPPRDLTIAEVRSVLETSFGTWTTVDCGGGTTGLDVDVLADTNACTEAIHNTSGHNVHSILFVSEGWSSDRAHDPRAYAVTYVWHDPETGEILDADMEINQQRGEYAICPEEGCTDGRIDLPNVLTHEIGHYFGIAHSPDDPFATMYASAPAGETIKRSLTADDTGALCTMYPPGALPSACDPAPQGGLDLSCAPQGNCGCRVPGGAPGASSHAMLGLALAAMTLAWRRRPR